MLYADDIRSELARGNRAGIEDAFRALVGWPGYDTIVGADAAGRRELLTDVATVLVETENGRIMPGGTVEQMLDVVEDLAGFTYADGARAVLSNEAFFDRLDQEGRQ